MKLFKRVLATGLVLCLGVLSMANTTFAVESQEAEGSIHYVRYDLEEGERESFTSITTGETEKIKPDFGVMGPSPVPNVIFDDNWTRVTNTTTFPYRAIAYLEMTWNVNGKKYVHTGTGFAAGDGKVLTAAHNLYNLSDDNIPHGEAPDSIKVVFGKNGSSAYRTATATEFYINSEWESHEDANYDYGVIIVPTSVTDYTGHFGLDYEANTSTRYTLSGYPYSGNYGGKYLYTASGKADTVNSKTIYHYLNATGGVSGAPLYSSDWYAVGLHTWSYGSENDPDAFNKATRVTRDVIDFVRNAG